MSGLVAVTARELRAHAPAAAIGGAAALLPWLAPLLPALGNPPGAEVRQATALAVAVLVGLGMAAYGGGALLARDLAEGRAGFYLALPLRARTLWLGKVLAVTLLVYGSLALALLPVAVGGGGVFAGMLLPEILPLAEEAPGGGLALRLIGPLLFAAPLLLVLLAHQLAVAVRARTPWVLLELGGLLAMGTVLVSASTAMIGGAVLELAIAVATLLLLAVVTLLTSGWAGLRAGVLLPRVHRAQSLVAGGGALLLALAIAGYSRWVVSPGPGAVRSVNAAAAAPAGGWAVATGPLRLRPSYAPWMLVNLDGRGLALSPGVLDPWQGSPMVFSGDGRSGVWQRPPAGALGLARELVWVELDGGPPRLEPTSLSLVRGGRIALSHDGALLAVREPGRLSLWSERGRRLLAATELEPRQHLAASAETLAVAGGELRYARIVERDGADVLEVRRVAPGSRPSVAERLLAGETGPASLQLSADGGRVLVQRGYRGRGPAALHDALSGEQLALLAPRAELRWRTARFLADGRIAVLVRRGGRVALRLAAPDGGSLRDLPLGPGDGGWVGAEWRAGNLPVTVVLRDRATGRPVSEVRELDLATGAVRRLAGLPAWVAPLDIDSTLAVGAPATRLFWGPADGRLLSIDPTTGAQRTLLPR